MNISYDSSSRCPCLSGEVYGACCGIYHDRFAVEGTLSAPTPEALMRSRFSAFAVNYPEYLLVTWAPETRPDPAGFELEEDTRWYRLDIVDAPAALGGDSGTVEFIAYYRSMPGASEPFKGSMHERSRFSRRDGVWYYVDGIQLGS